jgi:hypothetical protein
MLAAVEGMRPPGKHPHMEERICSVADKSVAEVAQQRQAEKQDRYDQVD